jgi:hypothetical protein
MVRDDAYLLDILLMAKDAREFTIRHTRESFNAIASASMRSSAVLK